MGNLWAMEFSHARSQMLQTNGQPPSTPTNHGLWNQQFFPGVINILTLETAQKSSLNLHHWLALTADCPKSLLPICVLSPKMFAHPCVSKLSRKNDALDVCKNIKLLIQILRFCWNKWLSTNLLLQTHQPLIERCRWANAFTIHFLDATYAMIYSCWPTIPKVCHSERLPQLGTKLGFGISVRVTLAYNKFGFVIIKNNFWPFGMANPNRLTCTV